MRRRSPPLLHELGVESARKLLDDVQALPIDTPDVDEKWVTLPAKPAMYGYAW